MAEPGGTPHLQAYEQSAHDWDSTFSAQALNRYHVAACWRVFQALFGPERRGDTLVELGVGTGLFTDRLAARFERLIAVDYSEQMLQALREKMAQGGISNVETLCSKAEQLEAIPDADADAVVCFGLLENIQDFTPLFREIARILKPGGLFAGVASNASCPWYALRQKLSGDKWYWKDVHLCTAQELRTAGAAALLREVDIRGWGLIPSQLPNSSLLAPVAAVERVLELSPIRRWMGGLAFRFDKA
ncbi:class I SAM-dependent methyltransferase [Dongia sp. agr-C8]